MADDIVADWQGNPWMLRPGSYWHLTPEIGGLIRNNARVGKGVVFSVSVTATLPGMSGATTRYAAGSTGNTKEDCWEKTRLQINSALPPRMKSFYCFDSKDLADRAAREWFAHEPRIPLELRIATAAQIHRCDAKLLEVTEVEWKTSAERYWRGEMTPNPFPEILVHGPVYFPDWEQFPFGF